MDLKGILSTKEKKEHYWSLVIEPGWVQAGIWDIVEGKVEVISVSPPAAWESDKELVSASDTVLSSAIQNFPEEEEEPVKTVFGVPGDWVEEGQIKEEYLAKIKNICSDLSLQPVGFVVLSEAISHYIKSEEGSPLSAIVMGVNADLVEVSVFKLGNLVGTASVARSISIVEDIIEGLSRFYSGEPFPSRFVLYDGKEGELEEVKQMLMSASWEGFEKVKFLHTPKVEFIKPENKISATALAGGAELASVTKVSGVTKGREEEEKKEEKEENVVETDAKDLGFVVGEDIRKASEEIIEKDLTFKEPSKEELHPQKSVLSSQSMPEEEMVKTKRFFSLSQLMTKFFAKFSSLSGKLKGIPFFGKNYLLLGILVFLIVFISGFVSWWYLPKATVTIFVAPQRLEEKVDISLDSKAGLVNLEERVIPVELIEKSVSGEKTASTTGTKTVGERAKGEVIIYRSGPAISISSGTSIKASSGLEFTLDSDIDVASGSASTPGTTKASVSAVDIGAQYNLASGENFSVSNYPASDIEAKSESAFSGGSSQEISAVSQEDQESLLEDLSDELKERALNEVESTLGADQYLVKESVKEEATERSFSNKVGDEASNLKLSLSSDVSVLVIGKENLTQLAQEILKGKVSSEFVLREDQIKVTFAYVGEEEGITQMEATFSANLLPQVKVEEISKKITGKYPQLARDFLTSIEGFERAEINVKPQLPGKLGTLPRVSKNISIEIEAER